MSYSKDNHTKVGFELLDEILDWERIEASSQITFTEKLQDNIDGIIINVYCFHHVVEGSIAYFSLLHKPNIVYVYNEDTEEIKAILRYKNVEDN